MDLKFKKVVFSLVMLSLAAFCMPACGGGGSSSVTPDPNRSTSPGPVTAGQEVNTIIGDLCTLLNRCDSTIARQNCIDQINNNAELNSLWREFGLTGVDSARDIQTQINNRQITFNAGNYTQCRNQFANVCTTPQTTSLADLDRLLSESRFDICDRVLSDGSISPTRSGGTLPLMSGEELEPQLEVLE